MSRDLPNPEELRAHGDAMLAASQKRVEEEIPKIQERIRTMPRVIGSQFNLQFNSEGKAMPPNSGDLIMKWDDGQGNIIFTTDNIQYDEVAPLAEVIATQAVAFQALSQEEQQRVRNEARASNGQAPVTRPYIDYLFSELVGERYEELEQNPPKAFNK